MGRRVVLWAPSWAFSRIAPPLLSPNPPSTCYLVCVPGCGGAAPGHRAVNIVRRRPRTRPLITQLIAIPPLYFKTSKVSLMKEQRALAGPTAEAARRHAAARVTREPPRGDQRVCSQVWSAHFICRGGFNVGGSFYAAFNRYESSRILLGKRDSQLGHRGSGGVLRRSRESSVEIRAVGVGGVVYRSRGSRRRAARAWAAPLRPALISLPR